MRKQALQGTLLAGLFLAVFFIGQLNGKPIRVPRPVERVCGVDPNYWTSCPPVRPPKP